MSRKSIRSEAQRMSFWSSDLADEPAEDLAGWLRNVEGSPFGGFAGKAIE